MDCRLCKLNPAILNSHVVSKFIWKLSGVIGAHKKFDAHCVSHPELSQRNLQDGFNEEILCTQCEGKRSKLEAIAREQLFASVRRLNLSNDTSVLTGLDYPQIKLFTMFQLWMMGVAKNPFYSHVKLGQHEEELRKLLDTNNPSAPWHFGTTLAVLRTESDRLDGLFTQPNRIRLFRHDAYRYVIAGIHCFSFVTCHDSGHDYHKLFLQTDGTWPVFVNKLSDYPYLQAQVQHLPKSCGRE
jgi:hypothetical protein